MSTRAHEHTSWASVRDAAYAKYGLAQLLAADGINVPNRDRFTVLCPFHRERTPSMSVSLPDQLWNCFGCGAGGDPITWIEQRDKVSFVEARAFLAEKAGIDAVFGPGGATSPTTKLVAAADQVQQWLTTQTGPTGADVRPTGGFWGWGYWPAGRRPDTVDTDTLQALGLINGRGAALLDGRWTLPLVDERGRTVGFAGRRNDDGAGPKWVNPPDTALYTKGRFVYGLGQLRSHVVQQQSVLVVEGYTDVHACWDAGFAAIAVCGTSPTVEQMRLVAKYVPSATGLFDGDDAGVGAGYRFAANCPADLAAKLAVCPTGSDPGAMSAEAIADAVAAAGDAWDAFVALTQSGSVSGTVEPRRRLVKAVSLIADPVVARLVRGRLPDDVATVAPTPQRTPSPSAGRPDQVSSLEAAAAADWAHLVGLVDGVALTTPAGVFSPTVTAALNGDPRAVGLRARLLTTDRDDVLGRAAVYLTQRLGVLGAAPVLRAQRPALMDRADLEVWCWDAVDAIIGAVTQPAA